MAILLNHQLREYVPHNFIEFPITYFYDELVAFPDWAGPLHWHPDFEIATAECGVLDYQVGSQHIILEAGDSIFVNGNMLHGIKQVSGDVPDSLPFIVFRHSDHNHRVINSLIKDTYRQMNDKQISYACGFNSVNYFSRQFKKKFGYAPSQNIELSK